MILGAVANAYPKRPITVIIPWDAGGGTDIIGRFMADKLAEELGVAVAVVNRSGGGGAVGHGAGARAAKDGYTITNLTLEIANMHWLGLTDVTVEDFDPIIQFNEDASAVMIKADAPWETIHDLLDHIRENPGDLFFSGSGAGTIWDLARIGLLHSQDIPVDAVTWVPTGGAAPSIVELMGGHVDVITCSLAEAANQVESGDLRVLAVMSDQRLPGFPDVPTLKEQGIDWSAGTWRGFGVPRGTPAEIVEVLEAALTKVAKSEEFADFMGKTGFGVYLRSSEEFMEYMREQNDTWRDVLRVGGYLE
ncbi:MAG: tripartite tricarboxylate transporter substrate binding protein [Firmicutes bacterium]|nr:tripartite tricarboxylate transporter substrate binding protein [Bacillota bacterium]